MLELMVFGAALTLACLLAARRGGPTERAGAALLTFGWIASLLAQQVAGRFATPLPLLIIDLALLAALGALAWKSRLIWPALASAFQAVSVASHLAFAYGATRDALAYLQTLGLMSFGAVIALTAGTLSTKVKNARF